jgi:transcriptional regulator with XRE-family HTH domain
MRRLLNLPAEVVAERAGISTSTLTRIESGSPGVALGAALSVARVLTLLDPLLDATDPYSTDLGRMRADQLLPKRIR